MLSSTHQNIYDRVLQQPMPHNLQWREVWAMLNAIPDANAVEDGHGNLKVTRNSLTLVLHRPREKDLADAKELVELRHFLERSAIASPVIADVVGTHLLVVIDHREARIFKTEMHGSLPQRIVPYDPFGFGRVLHYNQDDSNGQRKPELKSFYEAVAKTLERAEQIVLFGTGTGASSAMEQLLLNLRKSHKQVADRIIGSTAVDAHHLTEDQLLAKAREFFKV